VSRYNSLLPDINYRRIPKGRGVRDRKARGGYAGVRRKKLQGEKRAFKNLWKKSHTAA